MASTAVSTAFFAQLAEGSAINNSPTWAPQQFADMNRVYVDQARVVVAIRLYDLTGIVNRLVKWFGSATIEMCSAKMVRV